MRALWGIDEMVMASGGDIDGGRSVDVTGFSIDTRSIAPGDVFVALAGARDGHEFVSTAFNGGAAAAIVTQKYIRQPCDGALIRVADTLAALESIGRAARARLDFDARVIAVTGSVGKTGTKEMLRACLSPLGETHAADKSFNNHLGVPLTLARMPQSTRYGVFEIGMNHAGEIDPLTRMARPHVAIVTTVEPVHIENFASVEGIAEAKAEIFAGVEPGGTAVINRDNAYWEILHRRAREAGARIVLFGQHEAADVRALAIDLQPEATHVTARVSGRDVRYALAAPGLHMAQNSLAIVAALDAAGCDLDRALAALAGFGPPLGRGHRSVVELEGGRALVIDESYNANPASMRAALAAMALIPRDHYSRRIAVLGDMLELGAASAEMHAGLAKAVEEAGCDLVFASGPKMSHLFGRLPTRIRAAWGNDSRDIETAVVAALGAGDVVMVKGSNGSRMAPLVEALKAKTVRR